MTEQAAEWLAPSELKPWGDNPRVNDHAVAEVARSIETYGFGAPIVARKADRQVIAGHTRLKAAIQLGLERVPVRLLDISERDAKRLALVDNRTAELAEWDPAPLLDLDAELRLLDLGWAEEEIAALRGKFDAPEVDPPAPLDGSLTREVQCPHCGETFTVPRYE